MPEVNYVAVLVATVASFAIGAIWYSPLLFVKPWMAENGITPERMKEPSQPMARMYAIAFVAALLASYAMAALLVRVEHHSLLSGLKRGFAAGICWVGMSFASSYAFEQRSLRHWMINAGYYAAQFTVMGGILGLMNE